MKPKKSTRVITSKGQEKTVPEYDFLKDRPKGSAPPAAVTIAVNRENYGHTFLIIEDSLTGRTRMFHFSSKVKKQDGTLGLDPDNQTRKVIWGKGTFEEIVQVKDKGITKGKSPEDMISSKDLSCSEVAINRETAMAIIADCVSRVGQEYRFSLLLANYGIGYNCFTMATGIAAAHGVKMSTATFAMSLFSPRAAMLVGNFIADQKALPPSDKDEATSTQRDEQATGLSNRSSVISSLIADITDDYYSIDHLPINDTGRTPVLTPEQARQLADRQFRPGQQRLDDPLWRIGRPPVPGMMDRGQIPGLPFNPRRLPGLPINPPLAFPQIRVDQLPGGIGFHRFPGLPG